MEECTIIWPHYPETLAPGGMSTSLSARTLHMMTTSSIRSPTSVSPDSVRNEAWNKPRGSTQLAAVWSGASAQAALGRSRYAVPRPASHQGAVHAAGIGGAPPRSRGLGKKFFTSLQAKKSKSSLTASTSASASAATYACRLPIPQDLRHSLPPLALRGRARRNPAPAA